MHGWNLSWAVLAGLLALGCGDDADVGAADALAEEACNQVSHAATPVDAASDPADAPSVVLADGDPYQVSLPASGVGYVVFDSPHEHFDWAFFVEGDGSLHSEVVHLDTEATEHLSPAVDNGACPAEPMVDRRVHMHHTGSFLVEIHGEPEGSMWVLILGEPSDHHDGGHDNDHGDHHGEG